MRLLRFAWTMFALLALLAAQASAQDQGQDEHGKACDQACQRSRLDRLFA